ncbi:MAG: class I SAM-dependent methyltransferase [Candidatus Shapirobacteria bacterium]
MICPLCQQNKGVYAFTTNEFHGKYSSSKNIFKFYRCQKCFSYFPDITKININNYYTPTYRHTVSFIEKFFIHRNYNTQIKIIDNLFHSKQVSLLDVGCGNGEFINNLPKSYFKTGIDIKIDKPKPSLIQDDFIDHQFTDKFNLITFWHSLEHFTNPIAAIIKAKNILQNNGYIIISIPVSDSASFKLNPSKAYHLDPPRHIFIPNTIQFKKILGKYFSSVKVIDLPYEFPLDLYWTLKNSHKKYLIPIFPILKYIFPETKLFLCRR